MSDGEPIKKRPTLIPPQEVITMSRAVLGGIDLDPCSNPTSNRLVMAARYLNRDVLSVDDLLADDWHSNGEKRLFLGMPPSFGVAPARRMLHKLLREYRSGVIDQAIAWVGQNEVMTKTPWAWDFPICIPYRRLKPCYWDEEAGLFRKVMPADWNYIVYLPPCSTPNQFSRALSQFHVCFTAFGRVVMNQFSGEDDWTSAYRALTGKTFDFRG